MRISTFGLAILTAAMVNPALATPPDLICSGGGADAPVEFVIPLMTVHSSVYESGIVPMSAHHIEMQIGAAGQARSVFVSSDEMIAQWLDDGRADLRFYWEEGEGDNIVSYDLIIRTQSTEIQSEESGHWIHRGDYVFREYSGSWNGGVPALVEETTGSAVCE